MSSPHHHDRRRDGAERRLAELLRRWAGLALPEHRWPLLRATLEHLAANETVEGALDRIEAGDARAKRALLTELTIPETYLFRHPAHFEVLAEHARAAARCRAPYRVLSAGCATGEEAWSAAAVLDAVRRATGLRWEVVGWELDPERVQRARAGRYSRWSARNGLFGHDDAFEPEGQGWHVHPRLRSGVSFACVNLKVGPVSRTEPFDAVFLRNVAIYWAPECIEEMLDRLVRLVGPGGLLLMGASEPDVLDRSEWEVRWRGSVRVAIRRSQALQTSPNDRNTSAREPVSARPMAHARPRSTPLRPTPRVPTRPRARPRPASSASTVPVPPPALERVEALADRGRYLEALAILEALPPAPDAQCFMWRGIVYLSLHRFEDARVALRKAVFLAPVDICCRRWLAIALTACSRPEAASRERRNLRELSA